MRISNSISWLLFLLVVLATAKNLPVNKTVIDENDVPYQFPPRVINGADLPEGMFPFIVSIRGDDPNDRISTFCGGTLIHPQWIMTAAHCFSGKTSDGKNFDNPKLWHIQAGSTKIDLNYGHSGGSFWDKILGFFTRKAFSNEAVHVHAKRIVIQPKYKSSDIEWDIALMELEKPLINNPRIDTANLPPKTHETNLWPEPDTKCFLAGWGCTKARGTVVSKAQYAKLITLENRECSRIYKNGAGLNAYHEFCAGYYRKGVGICPGDSGSGLFCKKNGDWIVEGVASATHGRNPGDYPGVFTRVAYFRNWIDEVVKT